MVNHRKQPAAALIELHQCSVVLDERPVLDRVSFQLCSDQRWALIGANGSGKTLLLRLLRGELWPTPTDAGNERRDTELAREQIAYVGPERQDKYIRHDWDLTVRQVVTTGLFDEDIPLTEPTHTQTERVSRFMRRFGVWSLRDRSFLSLSYGQRRLALVARAFVGPARVLLLDEVFNGLADRAKAQLKRSLEARDAGREWIITTHRPKELPANITHVAKIEGGRIVTAGPVTEMGHLLHAPVPSGDALALQGDVAAAGSSNSKRRRSSDAVDSLVKFSANVVANASLPGSGTHIGERQVGRSVEAAALQPGVEVVGSTSRPQRRGELATARSTLSAKQREAIAALSATAMSSPDMRATPQPLVVIRKATLYRDYRRVIKGLDWTIESGTHWAVLGGNGSGKSTLLSLIYGDLHPALGGSIERQGAPFGTHIEEWKQRVGWVSPELQADYFDVQSLEEIVISGRYSSIGLNELPTASDRRAARRWMRFFEIDELRERGPRQVSYGQLRMALFARAMMNDPELLLLDEPCTGLDAETRQRVLGFIEQLAQRGTQLVMAVHDPEDIVPSVQQVLKIGRGGVSEQLALAG